MKPLSIKKGNVQFEEQAICLFGQLEKPNFKERGRHGGKLGRLGSGAVQRRENDACVGLVRAVHPTGWAKTLRTPRDLRLVFAQRTPLSGGREWRGCTLSMEIAGLLESIFYMKTL